jgi:hypothetical protein
MIFDEKLLVSKDQAVTTGTIASTDVLDVQHMEEMGVGKPVRIAVRVTETFNNLTNVAITPQDSADNSSFATIVGLAAQTVLLAGLKAGAEFEFKLPAKTRRYVRMAYVVTGTAATTGKVYSGIVQG